MRKHNNVLMKMSLGILCLSLLLVSPTNMADTRANSASQKIIMACTVSSETPVGKWIYLIYKEAFARLGMEFECPIYPAKRASVMADAGQVHGEPARASYYTKDHPNLIKLGEPVVSGNFSAFATDSAIRLDGWESLRGTHYRVEYMRGMKACEQSLPDVVKAENLSVTNEFSLGLKKLALARIDIFVHLETDVTAALQTEAFKDVNILKAGVMEQQIAYPYLHKDHQDLVPKLEAVLKKMREEGLIEKYQAIAYGE